MNGSIVFFDRSADVGARILDYLAGEPAGVNVNDYLQLVAEIYETFSQIHESISDVTIEVALAQELQTAQNSLARLRQMGLKDSLKAQQLCDQLEELGREIQATLLNLPHLDGESLAVLQELSIKLAEREMGAALLYDEALYDLHNLTYAETNLSFLKTEVDAISQQLVLQKARFDFLARKARHMLA
jgi:hypothetical protein